MSQNVGTLIISSPVELIDAYTVDIEFDVLFASKFRISLPVEYVTNILGIVIFTCESRFPISISASSPNPYGLLFITMTAIPPAFSI